MTFVERATRCIVAHAVLYRCIVAHAVLYRCIVAHAVLYHRAFEPFQSLVDAAPAADYYFSDGFVSYATLWYPGGYLAMLDKSQTSLTLA